MLRKIGNCRFPICISPAEATRLLSCWYAITDDPALNLASGDPALKEYFEIVSRNVSRARVRSTLEQSRGRAGSENEPRDSKRSILNEPSGNELLPQVSDESLLAQHSYPVLDPR